MKMAILELEYKNIRKITALKLPFTKADGSVISNNFIMMANGTGKTTTMELIKGLFDGTAAGWTASKVRSFAPTLTVLAPGAHSQFGSGKNTQFEPEQRANPFENVFSKTAVFPPPAIAETDL